MYDLCNYFISFYFVPSFLFPFLVFVFVGGTDSDPVQLATYRPTVKRLPENSHFPVDMLELDLKKSSTKL